ncbi:Hypothetical_protein [Hexamita inflata]|uniref:Hypothetical_protein n=1 Tax=Hexamita inflata TaxID=28002 RepID=A0AA86PUZ1_9EUKA|nr:Hypothetical protein HINF_LOCUS34056 [Hexamita inflata]
MKDGEPHIFRFVYMCKQYRQVKSLGLELETEMEEQSVQLKFQSLNFQILLGLTNTMFQVYSQAWNILEWMPFHEFVDSNFRYQVFFNKSSKQCKNYKNPVFMFSFLNALFEPKIEKQTIYILEHSDPSYEPSLKLTRTIKIYSAQCLSLFVVFGKFAI